MRIKIDLENSIKSERVKASGLDIHQKANIWMYIFLCIIFILIGILLPTYFVIFNQVKISLISLTAFMSFYCIGFLVLYGVLRDNRFVRISGKDLETNKRILLFLIKRRFNSELLYEGETMVTYYRRATIWAFSLRLIVVFKDSYMLINISRFNQLGIKSPFHAILSEILISSLVKDFAKSISDA